MPLKDDIFETLELKWGCCRPYDNILAKVDYIEQTDAGLKVHCHKVKKEKKMNKNEELKNVDTIVITRDGNTVTLNAYNARSDGLPVVCHKTIAECSPDDIFDFNIGAKLAFDRLYEGYDMTPKSKREAYNGKIFVVKYPGRRLHPQTICQVVNGRVKNIYYPIDTNDNFGGPYIFKDMTTDQLSKTIKDVFWGSGDAEVLVYFVIE